MNLKLFDMDNTDLNEQRKDLLNDVLFISINPDLIDDWGHYLNYEVQLLTECKMKNWDYICLANKKANISFEGLKPVFVNDSGYYSLSRKNSKGYEKDIAEEFVQTINQALDTDFLNKKYKKIILFFYCGSTKFLHYLSQNLFGMELRAHFVINAFWDFLEIQSKDYLNNNYLTTAKFCENITLLSMSELHSEYIQNNLGMDYEFIPNPPPLFSDQDSKKKIKYAIKEKSSHSSNVIFFPGLMSQGKGGDVTKKLLAILSNQYLSYKIFVRDRKHIFDNKKFNENINFITDDLTVKEIEGLYLESSIAILPYEKSSFEMRTSGAIVDCLLFNTIPVVFPNTWLAHICKKYNFGIICNNEMHESIVEAVKYIQKNYEKEKLKVSSAAVRYLADNSWQKMFKIFELTRDYDVKKYKTITKTFSSMYSLSNYYFRTKKYSKAYFIYKTLINSVDFLPYKQSMVLYENKVLKCNLSKVDKNRNFFQYNSLKKQKVAILSNCQGGALKTILKNNCNNFDFLEISFVHLLKKEDYENIFEQLKDVDLIISQPLTEIFGPLSQKSLKKHYLPKLILFPVLYFRGFNPELFYLKDMNEKTFKKCSLECASLHSKTIQNNKKLSTDYHDIFILFAYLKKKKVTEVLSWMNDEEFPLKEVMKDIWNKSLQELRRREKECDIKISDFIDVNSHLKTFHTFNHPDTLVLNEVAEKILNLIGFQGEFNKVKTNFLSNYQYSSYVAVAHNKHFKSGDYIINDIKITQLEAINFYYKYYDSIDNDVLWKNIDNIDTEIKQVLELL